MNLNGQTQRQNWVISKTGTEVNQITGGEMRTVCLSIRTPGNGMIGAAVLTLMETAEFIHFVNMTLRIMLVRYMLYHLDV